MTSGIIIGILVSCCQFDYIYVKLNSQRIP